jgi:hypothetical protein
MGCGKKKFRNTPLVNNPVLKPAVFHFCLQPELILSTVQLLKISKGILMLVFSAAPKIFFGSSNLVHLLFSLKEVKSHLNCTKPDLDP